MTGKILGQGAIRGEDGVRYYYDDGAIKNLQDVQNINGCEVDFEIKNGKAVDIFIIKSGESSGESKQNNNSLGQTLGSLGNLANNLGGLASRLGSNINTKDNKPKSDSNQQKISVDNVNDFIFSGIVSNSQSKLFDTSFDIGNKNFIWNNTLINSSRSISDGDEVAVCATPASNGQYRVQSLKNNTKGLFVEKSFFGVAMRTIPAIAIFGAIAMWCYILLSKGAYKSGFGLVFNLLFIACVILGYFIFKKFRNKDTSFGVAFGIFSVFMLVITLVVFIKMDFFQGWIFMISVVSSALTIEAIMFLKSNYNLTKLNDTIKNYKF